PMPVENFAAGPAPKCRVTCRGYSRACGGVDGAALILRSIAVLNSSPGTRCGERRADLRAPAYPQWAAWPMPRRAVGPVPLASSAGGTLRHANGTGLAPRRQG